MRQPGWIAFGAEFAELQIARPTGMVPLPGGFNFDGSHCQRRQSKVFPQALFTKVLSGFWRL
jgi:hypothetical protein